MRKVAILIHQYGSEIVGGAESYAKSLAEHLQKKCQVTVLTTASNDYATWKDTYPLGLQKINNVDVIRFSAEKTRNDRFAELCNELAPRLDCGGETSYREDFQWIDWEGPFCPSLINYVKTNHEKFDAFIVITYIYYIAVRSIPEIYDKTIFIPTAHDETWIRLSIMKDIFRMPRFFGFLTEEERDLVHERFHNEYIPSDILGIGVEINEKICPDEFKKKFNIKAPYLIYVGRIDASKSCDELIRYFLQYKKTHHSNLKLVLVGKGNMPIPKNQDIIVTGFVSEKEKYDAIAGAFAMVTPSRYESLCIALLEALALKIPVIANGNCAVLKGQCLRSNAGLYYTNEKEFAAVVDYLACHDDVYNQMGINGLKYIEERYRWEKVVDKVVRAVEQVAVGNRKIQGERENVNVESYKIQIESFDEQIEPVWNDSIKLVTSTDKNYADFAGLVVNSAVKTSADDKKYEFLILTNDLEDVQIKEIVSLIENKPNWNIRFVYMGKLVEQLKLNVSENYNVVTYFRLLLPQLVQKYEKVIYLDADLLILSDLAELWNVDIGENFIAATWDSLATAWQTYDSGPQAYFEALGIDEVGSYMQAGVFIFNIKEISRAYPGNYLIEQACNQHYILNDQDILNILCKGRMKRIDHAWNVRNYTEDVWEYCKEHLPRFLWRSEEVAVKEPKILHYCESSFPCWKTDRRFNNEYWLYAWGTPFYDHLIEKRKKKILQEVQSSGGETQPTFLNDNLLSCMKNDSGVKFDAAEGIVLYGNGGELYGPNIPLDKGEHKLVLVGDFGKHSSCTLQITAGARHIILATINVQPGINEYPFVTQRNVIDLEVLIKNESDEDIRITELRLQ